MENLFYFKKNVNGFYTYHMFPQLSERIIEKPEVVGLYTDREIYINEIVSLKRKIKPMDKEEFVTSTDLGY